MYTRRRRGNNFTESLHSFRQTDQTDLNCAVIESTSQDNSDICSAYKKENYKNGNSNYTDSIVLAGNSAEKPDTKFARKDSNTELQNWNVTNTHRYLLTENNSMTSETNCLFEKPDLNQRITQSDSLRTSNIYQHDFHSESSAQCSLQDNIENINPCDIVTSTVKEKCNKPKVMSVARVNVPIKYMKPVISPDSDLASSSDDYRRDTNYNIRNILNSSSDSNSNERTCTSTFDEENKDSNPLFDTIASLQSDFRQSGLQNSPQKILLRRLSQAYAHSPDNFTERLLTIIEESVTNNDTDANRNSAVSLRRLTSEFRRMCKFLNDDYIEDESTIDFAPSLMSPSTGFTPKAYTDSKNVDKRMSGKENKSCTTPPSRSRRDKKVYRKTPKTMFQKCLSNDSVSLNGAEDTFEVLESKCNILYSIGSQPTVHRRLSTGNLETEMENIRKLSELQMASLEISSEDGRNHSMCRSVSTPNLIAIDHNAMQDMRRSYHEQLTELKDINNYKTTPTSTRVRCKTADTSYLSLSALEKKLRERIISSPNQIPSQSFGKSATACFSKQGSPTVNKSYRMISCTPEKTLNVENTCYTPVQVDEMEKTLLLEIAEKRQRCLDTAKAIMEIDADPQIAEVKKSLGKYPELVPESDVDSLDNDSIKFLTTLISCDAYRTYLYEKSKPLCTLREKVKQTAMQSTAKRPKPEQKSNKPTPQRLPAVHVNDVCIHSPVAPQKRFFVTPGRSPTKKVERPKPQKYFSNLDTPVMKRSPQNIIKSPHASGLYRMNYNTVMSPVGMYIRGTDMNLIQTVRCKTNEMLLTPKKTGQNIKSPTPNKNPLKFNLTPKKANSPSYRLPESAEKETLTFSTNGNENNPDKFVLPKVVYKSPLKVQMVKDAANGTGKKRFQTLLQDTQHKVVIRHEEKNKPVQFNEDVVYDTSNDSIHVYQAAKKTNYVGRRNF